VHVITTSTHKIAFQTTVYNKMVLTKNDIDQNTDVIEAFYYLMDPLTKDGIVTFVIDARSCGTLVSKVAQLTKASTPLDGIRNIIANVKTYCVVVQWMAQRARTELDRLLPKEPAPNQFIEFEIGKPTFNIRLRVTRGDVNTSEASANALFLALLAVLNQDTGAIPSQDKSRDCLLYTSDAADDM
jgi:hypothetical protein